MISCNYTAEKKSTDEDSLLFYPSTPKEIAKDKFRYYYRAIQSFYDSYLSRSGFSGGILVAKEGAIIFERYTGFTNIQSSDSITANSSLHIASTSKTFTAMAILQLAKNNKLSIEDPVAKYLQSFPYPEISIKMLLNHRSGLTNYLYFIDPKKFATDYSLTNAEVLNYIINHKVPLSFKPDTRFNYCNTNYVLLALIIEKISQQPFPEFMQKNIFKPLGMTHTFISTSSDSFVKPKSYYPNWRPWSVDIFDGTFGDKNVYSTPEDLLKWSIAISDSKTFSSTLLDSAFKPYSNEKASQHNYGLGWRLLMLKNGKKIIYHNGLWHGSNSFFAILPEEKVSIIIIGNKNNKNIYKGNMLYNIFGNYLQNTNENFNLSDSFEVGSPK